MAWVNLGDVAMAAQEIKRRLGETKSRDVRGPPRKSAWTDRQYGLVCVYWWLMFDDYVNGLGRSADDDTSTDDDTASRMMFRALRRECLLGRRYPFTRDLVPIDEEFLLTGWTSTPPEWVATAIETMSAWRRETTGEK